MLGQLLDWLYPPKCMICTHILPLPKRRWLCDECSGTLETIEAPVCEKCGVPLKEGARCRSCRKRDFHFVQNISAYIYDDVMRHIIHQFKYGGRAGMGKGLAGLMAEKHSGYIQSMDCIIPVPMHRSKVRKRGYNQAALLAREAGRLTGVPVLTSVLIRARKTKTQSGLNPIERRNNMLGAFVLADSGTGQPLKGKRCLLLDDIFTTGATMDACAEVLLRGGAECVYGLSLSIAVKDEI